MKRADRKIALDLIKNFRAMGLNDSTIINELNFRGLHPYPGKIWKRNSFRQFCRAWLEGKGWVESYGRLIAADGVSTVADPNAPVKEEPAQGKLPLETTPIVRVMPNDPNVVGVHFAPGDFKSQPTATAAAILKADQTDYADAMRTRVKISEALKIPLLQTHDPLAFLKQPDPELDAIERIMQSKLSVALKKNLIREIVKGA